MILKCISIFLQQKLEILKLGKDDPMKKLTAEEYGEMAKSASQNTRSWVTVPKAFLVGGLICALGQGLIRFWKNYGISEEMAPTAASVTLVFLSALATGLNVYDKLAKHAGAGTLVPITGFANAVAAPALEFKSEGLVMGLGGKLFSIAGPVILYGTAASWVKLGGNPVRLICCLPGTF